MIPHGIDPDIFRPEAAPVSFPTDKEFKFLQTSFPRITEKGFDITIQAYCRAFSARDDVSLVLRVPEVRDAERRSTTFVRLEGLVREARAHWAWRHAAVKLAAAFGLQPESPGRSRAQWAPEAADAQLTPML